jgi:transposase
MPQISRIGLDIAKRWFQVHAVQADGSEVLNRKLARSSVLSFFSDLPICDVALEACGSAHYWARELVRLGHRVRLVSPAYVKPFVKRSKTDAHDARAICEAASRPDMRFVPIKSEDQQAVLMQHRARQLLVEQRTAVVNSLRAHLAEFGVIANKGIQNVPELARMVDDGADELSPIPALGIAIMKLLVAHLRAIEESLEMVDEQIATWQKASAPAQVLASIPGIGTITSAAVAASVPDPAAFRSGRDFAAWMGLVPRQHSSGGKERLGHISKQGNKYLRRLLVLAATSHLRWLHKRTGVVADWCRMLLKRRPARLVTIALANKLARICWAMMTTGELYHGEVMTATSASAAV